MKKLGARLLKVDDGFGSVSESLAESDSNDIQEP
jgi:hypothetical protein